MSKWCWDVVFEGIDAVGAVCVAMVVLPIAAPAFLIGLLARAARSLAKEAR